MDDACMNSAANSQQRSNDGRTVSVIAASSIAATTPIANFVGPGILAASFSFDDMRLDAWKQTLVIVPQADTHKAWVDKAVEKARELDRALRIEVLVAPETVNLVPEPGPEYRLCDALPLLFKICGAAAAIGYGFDEVFTVGKLVVKNLLSVGSVLGELGLGTGYARDSSGGEGLEELDLRREEDFGKLEQNTPALVRHVLRKILHPQFKQTGFVHVNSNEAVLHFAGDSNIDKTEEDAVISETLKQLEKDWHIRPVRIYADSLHKSTTSATGREFTISILNVCNTDIGGPSMIQLLDVETEAVGWVELLGRSSHIDYHNNLAREEIGSSAEHAVLIGEADSNEAEIEGADAADLKEIETQENSRTHDGVEKGDQVLPPLENQAEKPPESQGQVKSPPKSPSKSLEPDFAASPEAALDITSLQPATAQGQERVLEHMPESEAEVKTDVEPEQKTDPGLEPDSAIESIVEDVPPARREEVVEELHIRYADFDAALESIRSRKTFPESLKKTSEPSLLDLIRSQIKGLDKPAKATREEKTSTLTQSNEAAAEKDPDEEDYELV